MIVAGALLLIFGIIGAIVGIVILPLLCIGPIIAIVGILLLILGAVHEEPRPVFVGVPAYPPAPVATYCPQCGSALQWVPQYQRWYCGRCGMYR